MITRTKAIIAAAVVVPIAAAAKLIELGAKKGKGPLKALKEKAESKNE